jgi:hypothetical protein
MTVSASGHGLTRRALIVRTKASANRGGLSIGVVSRFETDIATEAEISCDNGERVQVARELRNEAQV